MTLFEALILGIVQGLTEFLPISSSGHLVLLQTLFKISEPMLVFDIMVHWGTLLALTVFFYRDFAQLFKEAILFLAGAVSGKKLPDLWQQYPYARLSAMIIAATIPAVLAAVFLDDWIESLFHTPVPLTGAWAFTGAALIGSRFFENRSRGLSQMKTVSALLIGLAQAVAIVPGVSRSGATIVMAMVCGFDKKEAARFSFLMAFPAIFGAGILKFKEGMALFESQGGILWTGFLSAALVGYGAIWILFKIIQRRKLHYFGYYCLLLSLLTAVYFTVTGV